jgi:hypothetical protein
MPAASLLSSRRAADDWRTIVPHCHIFIAGVIFRQMQSFCLGVGLYTVPAPRPRDIEEYYTTKFAKSVESTACDGVKSSIEQAFKVCACEQLWPSVILADQGMIMTGVTLTASTT